MVDNDFLAEIGVYDWEECATQFQSANLLLGNGFSMNISGKFRYESLFREFLSGCSLEESTIFSSFATTNFEAIQRELQAAVRVNNLFGIESHAISQMVEKLRKGLVQAIEASHPRAANRDMVKLVGLARQLAQFDDVFTLNYDLLLYHIIMVAKNYKQTDVSGTLRAYNDYFWRRPDGLNSYLEFMDYQNDKSYKHVYYLHGALFLFNRDYRVLKLKRSNGEELIDRVAANIQRGKMPLFVSEGDWQNKLEVINHNYYLRFAFSAFKQSYPKLVVYGTSLSRVHDKHIIDAINESQREIAIGIYVGDKTEAEIREEVYDFQSKLSGGKHTSIRFFDSSTLFNVSVNEVTDVDPKTWF